MFIYVFDEYEHTSYINLRDEGYVAWRHLLHNPILSCTATRTSVVVRDCNSDEDIATIVSRQDGIFIEYPRIGLNALSVFVRP